MLKHFTFHILISHKTPLFRIKNKYNFVESRVKTSGINTYK